MAATAAATFYSFIFFHHNFNSFHMRPVKESFKAAFRPSKLIDRLHGWFTQVVVYSAFKVWQLAEGYNTDELTETTGNFDSNFQILLIS